MPRPPAGTFVETQEGYLALCSPADYPRLVSRSWRVDKQGYAWTSVDGKKYRMHQLVRPARKGYEVDHVNEVKLDNRRSNLQYLTPSEHRRKTRRMKMEGLDQRSRRMGR